MFFKSQKSNGFNLEKTRTRNLHAFENLYSIICFAGPWLSILAIDYTKNYAHVKKYLNIRYVKNNKNGKPIRILSIFNLGLTIFRRCFNSYINYKIKTNMQLYLWLIQNFSFTFYVKLPFNTFCYEKNCNKISFLKNIAVFYIQIYQNQPKLIYQ